MLIWPIGSTVEPLVQIKRGGGVYIYIFGVLEFQDQSTTKFRCLVYASKITITISRRICYNSRSCLPSGQPRVGHQPPYISHTPEHTVDAGPEWHSAPLISFHEEFEQFASLL